MTTIQRPNKGNAFFSKLFQVRDTAHLIHLKTISYAKHKALDEFYSDLLGLIDGLAESIQGIYGLQEINILPCTVTDPVSYLEEFYSFLQQSYSVYPESWIKNQIDEISQLTASTLYKLKYLS